MLSPFHVVVVILSEKKILFARNRIDLMVNKSNRIHECERLRIHECEMPGVPKMEILHKKQKLDELQRSQFLILPLEILYMGPRHTLECNCQEFWTVPVMQHKSRKSAQ
jgi:hypothetical protein